MPFIKLPYCILPGKWLLFGESLFKREIKSVVDSLKNKTGAISIVISLSLMWISLLLNEIVSASNQKQKQQKKKRETTKTFVLNSSYKKDSAEQSEKKKIKGPVSK